MSAPLQTSCRRVGRECAVLRVRQAARVVTQLYDDLLAPTGLRSTQFSVLVAAGATEHGARMGAIARGLVVDRTTLTRNLATLEKDGLIQVAPSPKDARGKVVRLTEKGRRTLERALPRWERAQARLRSALGDSAWTALLGRLDHVVYRAGALTKEQP